MIEVSDAIKIARIISYAPEERIPMILSVFEQADITLEGLEKIEEFRAAQAIRESKALFDVEDFLEKAREQFKDYEGEHEYQIPAKEFMEFCQKQHLSVLQVRRTLAARGWISSYTENGGQIRYARNIRIDGKIQRIVELYKTPTKEQIEEETKGE